MGMVNLLMFKVLPQVVVLDVVKVRGLVLDVVKVRGLGFRDRTN